MSDVKNEGKNYKAGKNAYQERLWLNQQVPKKERELRKAEYNYKRMYIHTRKK
jgi:hypothetical protein